MTVSPFQFPMPQPLDDHARLAAQTRLNQLTKPVGSLGLVEPILCDLAAIQRRPIPALTKPHFLVFAADHGVATGRRLSRYGQHVTEEMVVNIAMGSSVSSVMARTMGIPVDVYDVGVMRRVRHPKVHVDKIALGTADFTLGPAMTVDECVRALSVGIEAARRAIQVDRADIVIIGEMGIGNTTSASALAAWLLELNPEDVVGPGTGISQAAHAEKRQAVELAIAGWRQTVDAASGGWSTQDLLLAGFAQLGGFELAAMAGAMIGAAALGVPTLLDGFLAGVCALWTTRVSPTILPYFIAGHLSPEPAHKWILAALDKRPLLDLGLRVGEGTGAIMAWPILQNGCAVIAETATFADARVDNPFEDKSPSLESLMSTSGRPTRSDFTDDERRAVYKAIETRRDIRVFLPDPVPQAILRRILEAGHRGPSVGYMQPWNFIVIDDRAIRERLAAVVERERVRAGEKFPDERRDYYLRLKVEGLIDAPVTLCVTNDSTRGGPVVLGRNTIPETDLMSTSCAIENMWLASRAEGVGMGWVSIYEKADIREILGIPEHVDPVALLSLGYTPHFPDVPVLERVGWRDRLDIHELIFSNRWNTKVEEDSE